MRRGGGVSSPQLRAIMRVPLMPSVTRVRSNVEVSSFSSSKQWQRTSYRNSMFALKRAWNRIGTSRQVVISISFYRHALLRFYLINPRLAISRRHEIGIRSTFTCTQISVSMRETTESRSFPRGVYRVCVRSRWYTQSRRRVFVNNSRKAQMYRRGSSCRFPGIGFRRGPNGGNSPCGFPPPPPASPPTICFMFRLRCRYCASLRTYNRV